MDAAMRILCTGLNHKTADVALREKVAFDEAQCRAALGRLAETWPEAEFVVLSTCNRSELYTARPVHGYPRAEQLGHWLMDFHGASMSELDRALYTLADADAVEHLFAVAAGLDSLVPGEGQIVSQMRAAYGLAVELGAARSVMNELFQTSFRVAKRVRAETQIARGKASVASVAVECVAQAFESLSGACVLNIGAGKMNTLMLRHLRRLGAERILVTNRSAPRAQQLAAACGGQAVPFAKRAEHLAASDVVVTSTASPSPVLTRKMIASAQRRRSHRPLVIVDIAVPRDVEPSAGGLKNVFLYNIDDLERIVRGTLASREGEQVPAERIVAVQVRQFTQAQNIRDVTPTIRDLYRRLRQIADAELAAAANKLRDHDDAEADAEILERAVHRTIRQILHPCVTRLRDEAGTDAARAHVASLRKLFDLDREERNSRRGHRAVGKSPGPSAREGDSTDAGNRSD